MPQGEKVNFIAKLHKIVPIFKAGACDSNRVKNYHPISLLLIYIYIYVYQKFSKD